MRDNCVGLAPNSLILDIARSQSPCAVKMVQPRSRHVHPVIATCAAWPSTANAPGRCVLRAFVGQPALTKPVVSTGGPNSRKWMGFTRVPLRWSVDRSLPRRPMSSLCLVNEREHAPGKFTTVDRRNGKTPVGKCSVSTRMLSGCENGDAAYTDFIRGTLLVAPLRWDCATWTRRMRPSVM
jgi:hypothetical protein